LTPTSRPDAVGRQQLVASDHERELEDFVPEWSIPPGEILQREIDARHMTQAQLAARTGLSTKHLNQVIKGLVPLSPETAEVLEVALGLPSQYWNSLEFEHRNRETRRKTSGRLQQFEGWLTNFKVPELKKRGIITSSDKRTQVEEVLRFLGVVSPDSFEKAWKEPLALSFRRGQKHSVDPYATAVWLRLGEKVAAEIECEPFAQETLRMLVPKLARLTTLEEGKGFSRLQEMSRSAGVAVAFVKEFSGSRASGATKWLSDKKVMIAISDRYKYADIIWFTVFHELAHALLHSPRRMYVDLDAGGDDGDGMESQADEFAQQALLPGFTDDQIRSLSTQGMKTLAKEIGVDAGVIAGRYAFITKDPNDYRKVASLRHRCDLKGLLA
jgi:HTH-type transcriptional regulator/antitoxin HigA